MGQEDRTFTKDVVVGHSKSSGHYSSSSSDIRMKAKMSVIETILLENPDLMQAVWDASFVAQFGTEKDKEYLYKLLSTISDLKALVVSGLNHHAGI